MPITFFGNRPPPQLTRSSSGTLPFEQADTNHSVCVSWEEFRASVKEIPAKKDDFEVRGFRSLEEPIQDALLKDHFQKMDSGDKGSLIFADWKE